MTKHGGKNDIVEFFRQRRTNGQSRFAHLTTIANGIGVSETRTNRILSRPTNTNLFRRSTGQRADVWTLVEFD